MQGVGLSGHRGWVDSAGCWALWSYKVGRQCRVLGSLVLEGG